MTVNKSKAQNMESIIIQLCTEPVAYIIDMYLW